MVTTTKTPKTATSAHCAMVRFDGLADATPAQARKVATWLRRLANEVSDGAHRRKAAKVLRCRYMGVFGA